MNLTFSFTIFLVTFLVLLVMRRFAGVATHNLTVLQHFSKTSLINLIVYAGVFIALVYYIMFLFIGGATFYKWAVQGIIALGLSGFLFRLLGKNIGTKKLNAPN